ncbi:hypothetical protein FDECE_16808 [Fusarium decemcellulare]|nr:hypothetical protein FDECE_16808 [Fusarium decemcellulare]
MPPFWADSSPDTGMFSFSSRMPPLVELVVFPNFRDGQGGPVARQGSRRRERPYPGFQAPIEMDGGWHCTRGGEGVNAWAKRIDLGSGWGVAG